MDIHHTHSKKDLIEIIECFELTEIEDARDMPKDELREEISDYIDGMIYLKPNTDNFFINTVDELKSYLKEPTPKQLLTNAEMEKVSVITKNIIFYCRECSFCLAASNFVEMDELIEDAIYISRYGDLPAVRRALKLLNCDEKMCAPIEPVMTKRMRVKLKRLDELKKMNVGRLKVSRGSITVSFD